MPQPTEPPPAEPALPDPSPVPTNPVTPPVDPALSGLPYGVQILLQATDSQGHPSGAAAVGSNLLLYSFSREVLAPHHLPLLKSSVIFDFATVATGVNLLGSSGAAAPPSQLVAAAASPPALPNERADQYLTIGTPALNLATDSTFEAYGSGGDQDVDPQLVVERVISEPADPA